MSPVIVEHYRGVFNPDMRMDIAFSLTEYSVYTPYQRELKRRSLFDYHGACRDDFQMYDCECVGVSE